MFRFNILWFKEKFKLSEFIEVVRIFKTSYLAAFETSVLFCFVAHKFVSRQIDNSSTQSKEVERTLACSVIFPLKSSSRCACLAGLRFGEVVVCGGGGGGVLLVITVFICKPREE